MNKKTDKPDENLTAQRIRENKDKVLELVPVMLTIKAICDAVGISRETYYDWLGKDSLFAEAVKEAKSGRNQVVEDKLMSAIDGGDGASIRFYLEKIHPEFKKELWLKGGVNINNWEKMSDEQLTERLTAIKKARAGNRDGDTPEGERGDSTS